MITPRRTTLVRAADLAAYRRTLTAWIAEVSPEHSDNTFFLVPTRAAGDELLRSVESGVLGPSRPAVAWPLVATRHDFYDVLAARLQSHMGLLSAFEREAIVSAVARELTDEGLPTPFKRLRPALVAEMLALYDHVRRLGRTVDDFERNFIAELEREQDTDRGAAMLLQQTAFLAAVFRGYQSRMREAERIDEHVLREMLLQRPLDPPLDRVVVTVGDRLADPDGVWPADLDLLARMPNLGRLDLINTQAVLASGLLERLYAALPALEEQTAPCSLQQGPILVAPRSVASDAAVPVNFVFRDREEELADVARRLKLARRDGSGSRLDRTALVVARPLPYLYLAREVFRDAGIPFEALDTLPLAAEPYAAAVDLVLEAVGSGFTRESLMALLRSPHFAFPNGGGDEAPTAAAIAACDFALADARYLGGLDRLDELVTRWSAIGAPASREERRQQAALPAARAALLAAIRLRPLGETRPLIEQVDTLLDWLERFDRAPGETDRTASRRQRVRAAILDALASLRSAYLHHDPGALADVVTLTAAIRRWLGSQTFATGSGDPGLQLVDAQAARYGDFDDLQIVGLIEGEWPERTPRNVLYPASLVALLEPLPATHGADHRDRAALQSARAHFKDLVCSATARVRLSTFTLEHDAVVEPSILLDEVAEFGLQVERIDVSRARVFYGDALALEPRRPEVVPEPAASWAMARLADDALEPDRYKGYAGPWRFPRVSVSRLERYLDCPFRFYASEVLRLEEQPEDEDTRTPLERGRFLHELWERFFDEWQTRGHRRVTAENLAEARALFEAHCEEALSVLPPSEAALERHRLLGSAVSPGIAHRVFAMEANRPVAISERLLEFPLQGDFVFRTRAGATRPVTLSAKVDRIDVLSDGTLRVIDYKSKKTPDLKQALQLPIYSYVAREALEATRGGRRTIAEAMYLSFEGDKAVVPLRARGRTIDELLDDAHDRLLTTLDRIAEGRFPPSPAKKSLCTPCPYRVVCRLEIVEREAETPHE